MERPQDKGIFIAIEGSDGTGKLVQLNLIKERLKAVGYDVESFFFPDFSQGSSYFAQKYSQGAYGSKHNVSPYAGSLFHSLEHFEQSQKIRSAIKQGKIVVATGYAGDNLATQASKISDDVSKRSFFVWADNLEFELLGIPRTNLSFFLRVPADKLKLDKNISKNDIKKYVSTSDLLAQLFPKDFKAVECTKNGKLLGVAQINNLIWEQIKPMLPATKQHSSHSVVVTLGADVDSAENASKNTDDYLIHDFKDVSLLLRLSLQRLVPDGISHSFDGWQPGDYRFYAPSRLPKAARESLRDGVEQLSVIHQQLLQKMAAYLEKPGVSANLSPAQILQPITPLGALSSFSLKISKDNISRVATNLLANDSEEFQWAAKQLYLSARQKWPNDFKKPLESNDSPAALNSIISKLSSQALSGGLSMDESIQLLEVRPKLEFDLLAETIYPFSSLSLNEISDEVASWPYSQKYQSLKEAASQSEVLKKVSYKMDILSDQITLDKIVQKTKSSNFQVQEPSPRYGYDMPKLIDDARADDLYDSAYDESLKIYSHLQAADREDITPYGCLLGHKVRWQINATAQEIKSVVLDDQLAKSPAVKIISEKLAEAHPLLWDVIAQRPVIKPSNEAKGKARVKANHRRQRSGKPKKS